MQRERLRTAVLAVASSWRDATVALVEETSNLEYAGTAATIEALGQLTPAPDVVVHEALNDETIEALLKEWPPGLPLAILTDQVGRDVATRVLRAGGIALLERDPASEQLAAALRAAVEGLCAISPAHALVLVEPEIDAPRSAEWIQPLTPRELQILRMLAEGLANRSIAAHLEISEHTAKFHVGQILAKLDAESRTEAVTIGIRHGLIMV